MSNTVWPCIFKTILNARTSKSIWYIYECPVFTEHLQNSLIKLFNIICHFCTATSARNLFTQLQLIQTNVVITIQRKVKQSDGRWKMFYSFWISAVVNFMSILHYPVFFISPYFPNMCKESADHRTQHFLLPCIL